MELNDMNIVIVGHVDHGKSTVIGRLLADTGSLPEGKLEQVKEMCRRNSRPFEYAFLLDALKDERSQGITIDTARCFFNTEKRKYIIIDAPGHIEFLKNMISGASRAEAALLVIDAFEGIQENSRRHGYMLSMLGIKQVSVLVNKMDLVGYSKETYDSITAEYKAFLSEISVVPTAFIPVSAIEGDNIALRSENMPWYDGNTVLDQLDAFIPIQPDISLPFRMPVQDVYKFTGGGDTRRIIAGTIETGSLKAGDEITFYPSRKHTCVSSLEYLGSSAPQEFTAGMSVGFTMSEQIYVRRGELAVISGQLTPCVSSVFKASIFWLGREPMIKGRPYILKIGSARTEVYLSEITRIIDASNLGSSEKDRIDRHDVAECILRTENEIAFDLSGDNPSTGRFVIVDRYEISGGGIITEKSSGNHEDLREKIVSRNIKWETSSITSEMRGLQRGQHPSLVMITGSPHKRKKDLARTLEHKLFNEGRQVYYMGIGNVAYGVDSDFKIKGDSVSPSARSEHIRRLGEVANILIDSGAILIVTATELSNEEKNILSIITNRASDYYVWVGDRKTTDINCDLYLSGDEPLEDAAETISRGLGSKGFIPSYFN